MAEIQGEKETEISSKFEKVLEENKILREHALQIEKQLQRSASSTSSAKSTRGPFNNPDYVNTLEVKVRVLEKQNYAFRQRILVLRNQLTESQRRHTLYDDIPSRVNSNVKTKRSATISNAKSLRSIRRLSKSLDAKNTPRILSARDTQPPEESEKLKALNERLEGLEKTSNAQREHNELASLRHETQMQQLAGELSSERKNGKLLERQLEELLARRSNAPPEVNNTEIRRLHEQLIILQQENKTLLEATLNRPMPQYAPPPPQPSPPRQALQSTSEEKLLKEVETLRLENTTILSKLENLSTVQSNTEKLVISSRSHHETESLEKSLKLRLGQLEENLERVISTVRLDQQEATSRLKKFESQIDCHAELEQLRSERERTIQRRSSEDRRDKQAQEERSNAALQSMEQRLNEHLKYVDELNSTRVRELERLQRELMEAKMMTPISTRATSTRSGREYSESMRSQRTESSPATDIPPPMPRLRKPTKKRQNPMQPRHEATPTPSPIIIKPVESVQPSDSELIFPDENGSSIITNPVAYDGNMTVIDDSNVLSIRIHRVALNSSSKSVFGPDVKVCYVDFLFLGGTHESTSCPIANTMAVHGKYDFIVDKRVRKDLRQKLIRFMGPAVFCTDIDTTKMSVRMSLLGESQHGITELASTSLNLYQIMYNNDLTEAELPLRKSRPSSQNSLSSVASPSQSPPVGSLIVSTRARAALVSIFEELRSMKESQRSKAR